MDYAQSTMPTTEQFATTTERTCTTTSQTTLVTTPIESSPTSIGNSEYTTQQASTQKTSTQVFDDGEFTSQQPFSETTLFTTDNAMSMTTTGKNR